MVRTVVLVSGGGTNLQAIIDSHLFGELPGCELTAVISSNPSAYALTRAAGAKIPSYVIDPALFPNNQSFSNALQGKLKDLDAQLVVLAGFMRILEPPLVRRYKNRIINIHPSLIPAFSGAGYYGLRVHEKALECGVKISGATAHFVTEQVDEGPIILQKAVAVREGDTPELLQRRIMEEAEWTLLPQAVALYCAGRLAVDGRVVRILEPTISDAGTGQVPGNVAVTDNATGAGNISGAKMTAAGAIPVAGGVSDMAAEAVKPPVEGKL